jgi:alanine dehydrogenase
MVAGVQESSGTKQRPQGRATGIRYGIQIVNFVLYTSAVTSPVRLLTDRDVRALTSIPALVDAMEGALAAFSDGRVVGPVRSVLTIGPAQNYVGVMPAFVEDARALGMKLVTVFEQNRLAGLPTHFATVLLLDPCTGALRAIMDGRYLTEVRTAAASAAAARHLASGPIRRLAILGSSVQARGHLAVFAACWPLQDVSVWSPGSGLYDFVREMEPQFPGLVRPARSAHDAVKGADVIVLVTSSREPVIASDWLEDGALVIGVGACRPTHREIDPILTARARLFVDSREAAFAESGDVILGIAEGRFGPDHVSEVGDVILGRVPVRMQPGDAVVFKSLGLAAEDVAAADMVLRNAVEQSVGVDILL